MGTRTKIRIAQEGVFFNGTKTQIQDSANMSYLFENEARRLLSLRWIGTKEDTGLPVWELRVEWPDDNLIVIAGLEITGYGEFVHESNRLVQIHASEDRVVFDGYVGEPEFRKLGNIEQAA